MNRSSKLIHICLFIICIIFNCKRPSNSINGRLNVFVTIPPFAEFSEQIGKNKVNVTIMVPPGASPHSYEPKPKQLYKLNSADLYIKIGTTIEFEQTWLPKILSLNPNIQILNASEGISLLNRTAHSENQNEHCQDANHDHHAHCDPHYWLSPVIAKHICENIYHGLVKLDSANQSYYFTNKMNYQNKLDSLHQTLLLRFSKSSNKKFISYHPAWKYFANAYHLEELTVEKNGKEPSVKAFKQIISNAEKNNIKTLVVSPQFKSTSIKTLAQEIKGNIIFISPLEKDYIKNLQFFADQFLLQNN